MRTQHIQGVGVFKDRSGYWESKPESLQGAFLSIDSAAISFELEERARTICSSWAKTLHACGEFIEANRSKHGLQAKTFANPDVILESGDVWSVYFDTELESEAVVGVEFQGNEPFQLTIGD